MKPFTMLSAVLFLCGSTLAGDREFDAIVHRMEVRYDTRHTRIPFFGLANFAVKVIRPAGASDLKLAVFEDIRRPAFTGEEDFTSLVQEALGQDWRPFVRVADRRNHEWTGIFAGGSGSQWKLLVVSMEKREATLIRIKLNPNGLMRWVSEPDVRARNWHHD